MAEQDVVDAPKLFLIVGTGTMLTIATVFAVQALFHWGETDDFERKNSKPPEHLIELRGAANEQIHSYGWLEKDKRAHIAIDRAQELVLQNVIQKAKH